MIDSNGNKYTTTKMFRWTIGLMFTSVIVIFGYMSGRVLGAEDQATDNQIEININNERIDSFKNELDLRMDPIKDDIKELKETTKEILQELRK